LAGQGPTRVTQNTLQTCSLTFLERKAKIKERNGSRRGGRGVVFFLFFFSPLPLPLFKIQFATFSTAWPNELSRLLEPQESKSLFWHFKTDQGSISACCAGKKKNKKRNGFSSSLLSFSFFPASPRLLHEMKAIK